MKQNLLVLKTKVGTGLFKVNLIYELATGVPQFCGNTSRYLIESDTMILYSNMNKSWLDILKGTP